MTAVPTLSPDDLVAELELIHRKEHRSFNTLLLARVSPLLASVDVKTHRGRVPFHVEVARCELDLRAALPDEPDATPTVVLLDHDIARLPADLLGTVANGMVYKVARGRRLRGCFSHAQIASDVEQCRPLVDALLGEEGFHRPAPPAGLVTLDHAWRAWLTARGVFGDDNERDVTLLLRLTREAPPRGLSRLLGERPELRAELDGWLRRALGPVAPWALHLWLEDRGLVAGALAFVLDGLRETLHGEGFVAGVLTARLDELSKRLGDAARAEPTLLLHWADLATPLAARCDDAPEHLQRILDTADRLLPQHEAIVAALDRSDHLTTSLVRRMRQLAEAFDRALQAPSDEALTAVYLALDALARHRRLEVDRDARARYERARMAARLLGWLDLRARAVAFSATESDVTVLAECAEDHLRHGCFADLARRVARAVDETPLGAAIARIVARVDARRDDDDALFAARLARWTELGRPMDRVVPIEAALETFAAGFLRGRARRKHDTPDDERRLAVLVFDGLPWSDVVVWLEHLEQSRIAPLRWRPDSERGLVPPVLSALPTLGDVARAALFAGQLLRPGDDLDGTRDPVRLANHRSLRGLTSSPSMLVRASLRAPSGELASDVVEHLRTQDRLVAFRVTEAPDASTPATLEAFVEQATLTNRAVLLAASHGCASSHRMQHTLPRREDERGGSRWRTHRSTAAATEGEIVVGGSYVWRPERVERVALVASEHQAYDAASPGGESGGATIAEVIAPMVLLGAESLAERMRTAHDHESVDPELEVRPLDRPAWWNLRLERSTDGARRATAPRPPPRREPPTTQPALPTLAAVLRPPVAPAPPAAPRESRWTKFFENSKAMKLAGRRLGARDIEAIEALDRAGGSLSYERLAAEIGLLPMRIGGHLSMLAEVLNADGTQVIQSDPVTRLVRLDVGALKEIFE